MSRVHLLGVCGTFMAGIATLAKALGKEVLGVDQNVYPPMSTYLENLGVSMKEGYRLANFDYRPGDEIIVGNVIGRGNEILEKILTENWPFFSGPEWLAKSILRDKWRLVVCGTHGKTTTSALLAWILERAGKNPGFLIGGIPENFGVSARLTGSPFFVIEGDEYDTAFSDKRSKFVHYLPKTMIINNLEYDHADIFPNVEAIERQFHHGVRLVPANGKVIANARYPSVEKVLKMGGWAGVEKIHEDWTTQLLIEDGSAFEVFFKGEKWGEVRVDLVGNHNVENVLSAIAAAVHVGVEKNEILLALSEFQGVKRRMQCRGQAHGVKVYDDFAHHPTAIKTTLEGLRARVGSARILAILEPRSQTMKMGSHRESLAQSIASADQVFVYEPENLKWEMSSIFGTGAASVSVLNSVQSIVDAVCESAQPGDHLLVMSNGGFESIHERLLETLSKKGD